MTAIVLTGMLVAFPFLGSILCYGAGKRNGRSRDSMADAAAALELVLVLVLFAWYGGRAGGQADIWSQGAVSFEVPGICGLGLSFELDGFRLIYGAVAAFMWMIAVLVSNEYLEHEENQNRFYLFLLVTLGAVMGVFFSADFFTTFLFFEIMSFTSYVWVAQEETGPALKAAATYLAVAVTGGLVMLMGLFLLYHELGTLQFHALKDAAAACGNKSLLYGAGLCLLTGFGAKAGAFPLHIWLPKAHPAAPAPASALLSGILTKTGVYGMLLLSADIFLYDMGWGKLILILGAATMAGGAVLAVFSVNLKRTLACSSMSQIGFIMIGIGMQGLLGEENGLAVHGTFLHMVNHSLIKLVLFLVAGVIYKNTHALDLNTIRGFGKKKPLLKGIFLTGALAIAGIPMFGGYISKTLLHESLVEFGGGGVMKLLEAVFLFSGGLTAAYMAKLYLAVFVESNASSEVQKKYDHQKTYMNRWTGAALTGSAGLLLVWGLFPHSIMDRAAQMGQGLMGLLETGEQVAYFSLKNLSGAGISIVTGVLVYVLVIRRFLMEKTEKGALRYVDRWPVWWDTENLIYRPLLLKILPFAGGVLCRAADSAVDGLVVLLRKTVYRDSPLPHELPEGNLGTELLGHFMNGIRDLGNRTWNRKHPVTKDYVHYFAVKSAERRQNNMVIGRSMSFALMLLCIGFTLTLVYLIWW